MLKHVLHSNKPRENTKVQRLIKRKICSVMAKIAFSKSSRGREGET